MFKKLLIATAILVTTPTFAITSQAIPYLGGSLGVNTVTASGSGSFRGMPATVFLGIGNTLAQSVYLGGELFGVLGTMELSSSSVGAAGLKTSYGVGASFMPGYLLTDRTLMFLRLGAVRSRFPTIGANSTGGQFGFGMQTNLMQNWDLRAEYAYTAYGSIHGVTPKSDLFNLGLVYKLD